VRTGAFLSSRERPIGNVIVPVIVAALVSGNDTVIVFDLPGTPAALTSSATD
jgi:hypothetical protein